jgi:hypothetical protein
MRCALTAVGGAGEKGNVADIEAGAVGSPR